MIHLNLYENYSSVMVTPRLFNYFLAHLYMLMALVLIAPRELSVGAISYCF